MNKMRIFFLFALIFSSVCISLSALDVYFVEPEVTKEPDLEIAIPDFSEELPKAVETNDVLNSVKLIPESSDKPVRSLIDAGALAMRRSRKYLLYGSVNYTSSWCEARLSLYELETDSVRTVFYSKMSTDRSRNLIPDLGRKLVDYLYEQFGITDRSSIEKTPGYAELSLNPGYWGVLSSSWSDVLLGYFHAGITGEIALSEPRYYFNGNELYPCFGLSIDYGLGRNRVGVENYFYHSLQASLPLELSLDLRGGHRFRLGIAPGYQFDFLVQERKYGDRFQGYSGAFLLKASFLYTYFPGAGNFSIGLLNNVDFAFYDNLQVSYRPSVFLSYKLTTFKEKKNEK